ncbi:unnamed protein product, partial [Prorocentrum cordatum]
AAAHPVLQLRAAGRRVPGRLRRRRNAAWHAAEFPPGGFAHADDAATTRAAAGPRLRGVASAAAPCTPAPSAPRPAGAASPVKELRKEAPSWPCGWVGACDVDALLEDLRPSARGVAAEWVVEREKGGPRCRSMSGSCSRRSVLEPAAVAGAVEVAFSVVCPPTVPVLASAARTAHPSWTKTPACSGEAQSVVVREEDCAMAVERGVVADGLHDGIVRTEVIASDLAFESGMVELEVVSENCSLGVYQCPARHELVLRRRPPFAFVREWCSKTFDKRTAT